jgi:hypothetical protein
MGNGVTTKSRLNLLIDSDLKEWAKDYAKRNGKSVTDMITGYFLYLRQREQDEERRDEYVEQV